MPLSREFDQHQLRRRDWAPLAFIASALFGVAAVVASKSMNWSTWLVVSIPIGVITGYGLLAWLLPRFELRQDQIGDNLYYLGFLLTLASLSTTLAQFSAEQSNASMVSNFGLALVATITGIAGRTLLSQLRKDVVSVERDVHKSLSEASLALRGEIQAATESFASLQRQIAQISEESVRLTANAHTELASSLVTIAEEQNAAMQAATSKNIALLQASTQRLTESLSDFSSQHVLVTREAAAQSLAQLTREQQQLQQQLTEFTAASAERNAQVLEQLDSHERSLAIGTRRIERAVDELEQTSQAAAEVVNKSHSRPAPTLHAIPGGKFFT